MNRRHPPTRFDAGSDLRQGAGTKVQPSSQSRSQSRSGVRG